MTVCTGELHASFILIGLKWLGCAKHMLSCVEKSWMDAAVKWANYLHK